MRIKYRTRLGSSRVIMAFFALLSLAGLVGAIINGGSATAIVLATAFLLLCAWWFHLWGLRGDPPPGARNRLPWQ